jgi:hypothetical protein
MEFMANDIDTVLQQIKQDNNDVIMQLDKAFHSFGNNRTLFDSLFVRNYGLNGNQLPTQKLTSKFNNETPGWYLPSSRVVLHDSVNEKLDYYLMLSEGEMKELKAFIKSLSAKEVDLKYQAEIKKKAKRPCNCPEDNLFQELEPGKTDNSATVATAPQYAGTRKIRKYLYHQYMQTIKYCKLCKERAGMIKQLTLAQAQLRITGCPTSTPMLNDIQIKNIKKKKIVPDKELDSLITYFKGKQKDLNRAESFESNGQLYYWLDKKYLP